MITDNEIRDLWTEKCAAKCGYDALIIDFARLVEQKTRDECAQECETLSYGKPDIYVLVAQRCAAAIRGSK